MSELYVMSVPVLSTAHLTPETYERLEADIVHRKRAGALSFDYFDRIDSLWTHVDEDEDTPQDLVAVFRWAVARDYMYIRFDGEIGAIVPELPSYAREWL
jgi:hypothetical protein